jgi:putative oxidoreductase
LGLLRISATLGDHQASIHEPSWALEIGKMNFLAKWEPQAYALLRIVVGLLYACHGAQKLFGAFGGQSQLHNPMMLVAATIEFVGGLLMAIGFFTRIAAFLASGEMAAAYFMVHARAAFLPIVNKGELAVVYCFLFLYIATRGGGRYAVDRERTLGFTTK